MSMIMNAPTTIMATPGVQAIPVGASGNWANNPALSQHYYPAQTYATGMQAPANLFHDPNVINTNMPGYTGTQFVLGGAQPQPVFSTPTLAAPTYTTSTVMAPATTFAAPVTTMAAPMPMMTTLAAPAGLTLPQSATTTGPAEAGKPGPAKRDAKATKAKKKKSCGSC